MSEKVVRVGAVAYDPKVVTIWEGFREYFREAGVPTDYVLFSNYEALIEAMFDRQIDIAWNTNVAYVRSQERTGGQCQALAMRNTDQDFTTRLIARSDSGIYGLTDLRGKRLALGSADSGQAAILPLFWLREAGIDPDNDLEILSFNSDVGKHGDTGTSELQVLQALHEGSVDAGMIGHVVWLNEQEKGSVNMALLNSVWTSSPYSHCNFTALPDFDQELASRWSEALLSMDYNDPKWRSLMDLEGLTSWELVGNTGYESLAAAITNN